MHYVIHVSLVSIYIHIAPRQHQIYHTHITLISHDIWHDILHPNVLVLRYISLKAHHIQIVQDQVHNT